MLAEALLAFGQPETFGQPVILPEPTTSDQTASPAGSQAPPSLTVSWPLEALIAVGMGILVFLGWLAARRRRPT